MTAEVVYSGAWTADFFYSKEDGYRGEFEFEIGGEATVYGVNWKAFREEVVRRTGVALPMRKYFHFQTLSDYEQIAGIDAANPRPTCMVNMMDRLLGWRRDDALVSALSADR